MTLQRYAIEYNDGCCPPEHVGTWRCKAHDMEHALDKFYDSDEGFKAERIAHIPEGLESLSHRWVWEVLS